MDEVVDKDSAPVQTVTLASANVGGETVVPTLLAEVNGSEAIRLSS